jgi:FlaA1/EpsC-like NDP-sugar epimerase
VIYFCDDDKIVQDRSIDAIKILSPIKLKEKLNDNSIYDLLVIAMPSASQDNIKNAYNNLSEYFNEIKILPSFEEILQNKDFKTQLKDISVEDLLARHPKDLDKTAIKEFVNNKTILVTGAGGSIGSEIVRQCKIFGATKIIALDNSEYNLYAIDQDIDNNILVPVMQNVVNLSDLEKTFKLYLPNIVIHAAAYKHVPLVEENISEAIVNNIIGTKNIIDLSCKYNVQKVVLISTDKAVRPTNVMGTTKRICELYAQNKNTKNTIISAVRFGNVLGSSGSIIPKFKQLISEGKNLTVTHKDITRYFMLIPEACELVLQSGALGKGGEIFILDMGEEVKIVDLANKMIELSGRDNISIEFTGLRTGEKLYEELLIDDSQATTKYDSITVAKPTLYDINELEKDINQLLECEDKIKQLQKIVPEFNHKLNKNN